MAEKRDLNKLREALAERMDELCESYLGSPTFPPHGSDWRYRRKGSLSVNVQTGKWFDNDPPDDKKTGGPLDFIMRGGDGETSISLDEACKLAEAFLAKARVPIIMRQVLKMARSQEEMIAHAQEVWDQSIPIEATLADAYLRTRGIRNIFPSDLRFKARCWHSETKQHLPAMIAAMRSPHGNTFMGVHRTFLKSDGSGKADVHPNKKMMGRHGGSVIKLTEEGEIDGVICLTEGIENALSANMLGYSAVWAAASAGGVAAFKPLRGIRELVILADNDVAGLRAADECARVWRAAGRKVVIKHPATAGHDLNDFLMARAA